MKRYSNAAAPYSHPPDTRNRGKQQEENDSKKQNVIQRKYLEQHHLKITKEKELASKEISGRSFEKSFCDPHVISCHF